MIHICQKGTLNHHLRNYRQTADARTITLHLDGTCSAYTHRWKHRPSVCEAKHGKCHLMESITENHHLCKLKINFIYNNLNIFNIKSSPFCKSNKMTSLQIRLTLTFLSIIRETYLFMFFLNTVFTCETV